MDRKEYSKKYHIKNKEKHNKASLKWNKENPEASIEQLLVFAENILKLHKSLDT